MYALFPNEARTYLSKHRTSEKVDFLLEEESSNTKEDDYVDINQIQRARLALPRKRRRWRNRSRGRGRSYRCPHARRCCTRCCPCCSCSSCSCCTRCCPCCSSCRSRFSSCKLVLRNLSDGGHVLCCSRSWRTCFCSGWRRGCCKPEACCASLKL